MLTQDEQADFKKSIAQVEKIVAANLAKAQGAEHAISFIGHLYAI